MLTEFQRSRARFDGGKDYSTRVRQARTVENGLRGIVGANKLARSDVKSSLNTVELADSLTEDEARTLAKAAVIVGKVAAILEADTREANRIKADYEKRRKDAATQLRTLPHASIDEIVALLGAESRTPLDRYEMDRIRNGQTFGTLQAHLREKASNAIGALATTCAYEGQDPAEFTLEVADKLPGLALQHADLISELTALTVAEQLERTR